MGNNQRVGATCSPGRGAGAGAGRAAGRFGFRAHSIPFRISDWNPSFVSMVKLNKAGTKNNVKIVETKSPPSTTLPRPR